MSIDKTKIDAKITSKLCNVLVNCQELVEDLEDLESVGLYRQNLKANTKNYLNLTLAQVDKVFGVGQRKVIEAIKAKKTEEEIEAIRQESQIENKELVHVYETAMKSRLEYRELEFNERLLVLRILQDIREGNVKYVGSELYYHIKSKDELTHVSKD